MGRMVLEVMKTAVEKVGTAVLTTVAQTLSGAINEINSKIPSNASDSNKFLTANDIAAWAKASAKPNYSWSEISNKGTINETWQFKIGVGTVTTSSIINATGIGTAVSYGTIYLNIYGLDNIDSNKLAIKQIEIINNDSIKVTWIGYGSAGGTIAYATVKAVGYYSYPKF